MEDVHIGGRGSILREMITCVYDGRTITLGWLCNGRMGCVHIEVAPGGLHGGTSAH